MCRHYSPFDSRNCCPDSQFTNYRSRLDQKLLSIFLACMAYLCYKVSPEIVGLGNELAVLARKRPNILVFHMARKASGNMALQDSHGLRLLGTMGGSPCCFLAFPVSNQNLVFLVRILVHLAAANSFLLAKPSQAVLRSFNTNFGLRRQ